MQSITLLNSYSESLSETLVSKVIRFNIFFLFINKFFFNFKNIFIFSFNLILELFLLNNFIFFLIVFLLSL